VRADDVMRLLPETIDEVDRSKKRPGGTHRPPGPVADELLEAYRVTAGEIST
jgi:hypothetical protein